MLALRFRWLVGAGLCLSVLAAQAVPLPHIKTRTSANYQGDNAPDDSDSVNFPVLSLPASAVSRSYVPVSGYTGIGRSGVPGLPDIECGFDDADAFAIGQLPGNDGAYARAGGFSPGHMPPPNNVNASASVELYRNYLVIGSGAVNLDLVAFFDGFLYVGTNSGFSSDVEARVTIDVEMDSILGTAQLFHASAILNHLNGFSTSGSVANGYDLTGFNNAWADTTGTLTGINGHDRLRELNYLETFNSITSAVGGTVVGLKYSIRVEAINNEGPFEIFSTADFSHTFKVGLDTSDPESSIREINLVVPEPSSLTALGSALMLIVLRRRSRRV